MARWTVSPLHAYDADGVEVSTGSKKAIRWVQRWRVDGFKNPRKRTFARKDSLHPKRDADNWHGVLQQARLYGWDSDERGWPTDPTRAAVPAEVPAMSSEDTATFEEFVFGHWWPARKAQRLSGNTYEGNETHAKLAVQLLRYQPSEQAVTSGRRPAGASVRLSDLDTARVQAAVTARASIDLRARRLNEQALARAARSGTAPTLRPEVRDMSARAIQAFAVDLGMILASLPASRLHPDFDWGKVKVARPRTQLIDPRDVPSVDDAFAIAERTAELFDTQRWVVPIRFAAMGGQRLAEHRALTRANFVLSIEEDNLVVGDPDAWLPHCRFADSEPPVSKKHTASESAHESRPLKHRAEGAFRKVPILPEFVPALETHFDEFGPRLWTSVTGKAVDFGNFGADYWRPAVEAHFTSPTAKAAGREHLASTEFRVLRKTAISWWLRSGVSVKAAAGYAGHSPDVLLRIYASFIGDEDSWTMSRLRSQMPSALR